MMCNIYSARIGATPARAVAPPSEGIAMPASRRGRMRAGKGLRDSGTSMQMVGVGAGVTDAGFSTKRRFEGDRRQLIRHHRRFWAAGTIAVPARVGDF